MYYWNMDRICFISNIPSIYINSKYSIVSQPTTYCMSISKEYEEYLIACETNYTEYDYLNNRKEFYKHEKEI